MLLGKLVFVLGAGASRAFGENMPIGAQLADTIQEKLHREFSRKGHDGPIKNGLRRRPGGMNGAHEAAAVQIIASLQSKPSIDELIDEWPDRPEIAEVGKAAIAASILEAEAETQLSLSLEEKAEWGLILRKLRDTWAGTLVREIGGPSAHRRELARLFSEVAFVTFNYDRCLEQYLMANLLHTASMSYGAAADALRNIEIHHCYGSLGDLPFGSSDGVVDYGSSDLWAVMRASERIKTFSEDPGEVGAIQSLVQSARRIVFIGFGFHDRNIDLLFGEGLKVPRRSVCMGTQVGLRPRVIRNVDARFADCNPMWEDCYADKYMEKMADKLFDRGAYPSIEDLVDGDHFN